MLVKSRCRAGKGSSGEVKRFCGMVLLKSDTKRVNIKNRRHISFQRGWLTIQTVRKSVGMSDISNDFLVEIWLKTEIRL